MLHHVGLGPVLFSRPFCRRHCLLCKYMTACNEHALGCNGKVNLHTNPYTDQYPALY